MSESNICKELSPTPFLGKVISVTGAGQGIGLATAQLLYARGATVCVADINPKTLAEAEKLLREKPARQGQKLSAKVVDVTKHSEVSAWIEGIVSDHGRIDGAANVAGGTGPLGPLDTRTTDHFDFAMDLNFRSGFNCLNAQLKVMTASCSIVNVSTDASLQPPPDLNLYAAAKGAINSLTGAAARGYGPKGIRVNAVAPGVVLTPGLLVPSNEIFMKPSIEATPLGRAAQPVEVAKAIAFLLSDEASYISGVILRCDGGFLSLSI